MKQLPKRQSVLPLFVAIMLLLSVAPVQSQPAAGPSTLFILSSDRDENTLSGKWVWLIYTEAFKRMGMRFQLSANPLTRQSMLADEGQLDGEVSRVAAYGAGHPNLIRVEESVLDLGFALYTANPALRIARLEDLSSTKLLAEYRRGIGVCENSLKQVFPPERLSDVTSAEQGAKKLLAGRTDLYCDNDITMLSVLHLPEIRQAAPIYKAFTLGAAIPTYPYLHKKHAELAPRLAATLKKMKAEGLIEVYRLQAEHDMGWTK